MNVVFIVTTVAIFLLLGVVFLIAPALGARVVFGCTVPDDFTRSQQGRRILRGYRVAQIVLWTVLLAAFFALHAFTSIARQWLSLALELLYVAGAGTLWFDAHRRTRPHAVRIPLVRTAPLLIDRRIEQVHLAALLPLSAAAGILALAWQRIPAVFPLHWGANGLPNHWVHRSPGVIFSPLPVAAAVILLLWLILRYGTPGSGRGRWILPQLAWCFALIAVATSLLPLRPHPAALPVAFLIAIPAMVLLVVGIAVVSSLRPALKSKEGDGTPDERWIGGIFYYNPQDPALWVEKRMGIGWTPNYGRPAAWFLLGGILLFVLILVSSTSHAHH